MTKELKCSVFDEIDEDHTSEDFHLCESLTTTLWEPEKTDDTEKNRRADLRDAGYSETHTNVDSNPAPPAQQQVLTHHITLTPPVLTIPPPRT